MDAELLLSAVVVDHPTSTIKVVYSGLMLRLYFECLLISIGVGYSLIKKVLN